MIEYLLIGKIIKPHGLKGEVKIKSSSFFSSIRYKVGNTIYLKKENEYIPLVVNSYSKTNEFDVVSFLGYLDINLINDLLGKELYIIKDYKSIPNGYYYFSDLVKCKVITDSNLEGKVVEVLEYPANIILKVNFNGKIAQIPFVDEYIKNVDIENKIIYINLIEGMI